MIGIDFAEPTYLWGLLLVPLLWLIYEYGFWRKRQTLARFAFHAERLSLGGLRRIQRWRALAVTAAAALLVTALAGPQWGRGGGELGREGRDLVIMLDVSLSMLAGDLKPNRLQFAKRGVAELLRVVRAEGGHRIALVAFAGRASLQCPLTPDYNLFEQRLNVLDVTSVRRHGTLLGDALRQALEGFGELDHQHTDIILLSDGEDHGSFPLQAAAEVKALGVDLHVIGLGDNGDGALIPVTGADGRPIYLTYQDHPVRTRLRQSLLLELARVSGGRYLPVGLGQLDLPQLYREFIAGKPRRPLLGDGGDQQKSRFQWFIIAALLLFGIEMLLMGRSRERERSS